MVEEGAFLKREKALTCNTLIHLSRHPKMDMARNEPRSASMEVFIFT